MHFRALSNAQDIVIPAPHNHNEFEYAACALVTRLCLRYRSVLRRIIRDDLLITRRAN